MENTSKEINNIITVDQVEYDVTELAFNLLKAPFVSVKDSLFTNNIRLPRKLRMDAMKVSLRPLIVKTRNECLTLDQQLNYRLLWFNKFSEGQMAFYFGHFKDKELNQLYGQKLYKNILLTLANSPENEEYQSCLGELIALANKYSQNDYKDIKIKDFIPAFDPIFYDPKNSLDGLPISEFRPICYNSATKDQLMQIGEKYNVEVPKKINKDTIFDYVVAKLKAMKVDTTYLIENEKSLKVKDIREFAFQQGLDTAGELTKKEVIEYILQRALTTKDNYECPRSNQVYEMNIPISDEEAVYDKLMVERIRIQEEIKRESDALRRLQGEELAKAQEALEAKTREQEETEKELERVKTELENKFEAESLKSMEDLDTTLDDYNFDGPTDYGDSNAEFTTPQYEQTAGQESANYYDTQADVSDTLSNNNDENEKEGETLFNNQNPNEEPEVIDIDDMDFGDFSEQLKDDKPNAKKGRKQASDQFASSGAGNSLMIYQSANELMVIQKATKKKAKLGSIYAMIILFVIALITIGAMIAVLQQSKKLKTVSYALFRDELQLEKNGAIKSTVSDADKDKTLTNSPITGSVECKPRRLVDDLPWDAFSNFRQKAKDPKTGKTTQIPFDYRIHKYSGDQNPGLKYFKDSSLVKDNKIDFKLAFDRRTETDREKYVIEIFSPAKKIRAYLDLNINFNNIVEIVDYENVTHYLTRDEINRVDDAGVAKLLADTVIRNRKAADESYKPTDKHTQDLREWYADESRVTKLTASNLKTKTKLYCSQKRHLGWNVTIKFDNPTDATNPVTVSFVYAEEDEKLITKLNDALGCIRALIASKDTNYIVDGWKMTKTNTGTETEDILANNTAEFDSEAIQKLKSRPGYPQNPEKSITIDLTAKFNREKITLEFYNAEGTQYESNPFEGDGEWPIKLPLKSYNVDELITKFENRELREKEEFRREDEYFSHWQIVFGSNVYTFNDLKDPSKNFETIIGSDNLKVTESIQVKPVYRKYVEVNISYDCTYAISDLGSYLEEYLKQPYRDNIKLYHDTKISDFINNLTADSEYIDNLTRAFDNWDIQNHRPYGGKDDIKIKVTDFKVPAGKTLLSELDAGDIKLSPEYKPIKVNVVKEELDSSLTSVQNRSEEYRFWVKRTDQRLKKDVIKSLFENPDELKGLYIATREDSLKITPDAEDNSCTIELKLLRVEIDLNTLDSSGTWGVNKDNNSVYGQKVNLSIPEYSNFEFKGFTKQKTDGSPADSAYLYKQTSTELVLNYENLLKAKGSNGINNLNNLDKLEFISDPTKIYIKTLNLYPYYARKTTGSLTIVKNLASASDNNSIGDTLSPTVIEGLPLGVKYTVAYKTNNTIGFTFEVMDKFFKNEESINKLKDRLLNKLLEEDRNGFNKYPYSVSGEVTGVAQVSRDYELTASSMVEVIDLLYTRETIVVAIDPENSSYKNLMNYEKDGDSDIKTLKMWVGASFQNNTNNWKVQEPGLNVTHEFKYFTFQRNGVKDTNTDGTELRLKYQDLSKLNMIRPLTKDDKNVRLVASFDTRTAKIYPHFVVTNEEDNQFEPTFTSITDYGKTASKNVEQCTINNSQVIIDATVGQAITVDINSISIAGTVKPVDIPKGFAIAEEPIGFGSSYPVPASMLTSSESKVYLYFKLVRKNVKLSIIDKENNEIKSEQNVFAGTFLTSELIKTTLSDLEVKKNTLSSSQGSTDTYSIDTKSLYTKSQDNTYLRHNLTDIQIKDIKGDGEDLTSEIYCGFTINEVTLTLYIIESDHNNTMPEAYRTKVNNATNALINPKDKLEGADVVEAVFQVRANEQVSDIYTKFVESGFKRDGFGPEMDALGQPVLKALTVGAKNSENAFFYLLKRNRYTVKLFDDDTQEQINSDIDCYHGLTLISCLGGIDPNNGGMLNGKEITGFINKANNSRFNENDPILSDLELIVEFKH